MKKRFFAIILCLLSVFLFCGCAKATYYIQVESTGVVTQALQFSFSKTKVVQAGKTVAEFKNNVIYVANSVVKDLRKSFEESHNLTDKVKTWSNEECTFAEIIAYVYKNMDVGSNGYRLVWEPGSDGDTINCTISIRFLTIDAYEYFYDIYPDTEEELVTEDHLFYVKKISESQTPFYDLKNSDIANYFLTYFDNNFTLADVEYSFCYVTQNQKMYSDADYVEEIKTGYAHYWKFSAADIENGGGAIHTYTVKIRAYPWYISAIVISVVVWIVLWIVCKAKEKKQQKANVDMLNFENNN